MKLIEVESCPECPYRQARRVFKTNLSNTLSYPGHICTQSYYYTKTAKVYKKIDKRIKTFPRFCPLKDK